MDRDHWLDHADDTYDKKIIDDIKAALQVLKLFIPLPIFWALFDQQGSRWTFQASRMDGQIGSYLLKSDQMQVVNPLFIVIFIPIFETCIYPVMAKIRFIDTPLKKLTTGGFLAAVAFIVSALVEMQLEVSSSIIFFVSHGVVIGNIHKWFFWQKTYPVVPTAGLAQIRVFNPLDCNITGTIGGNNVSIGPYDMWTKKDIEVSTMKSIDYSIQFGGCETPNVGQKGTYPFIMEIIYRLMLINWQFFSMGYKSEKSTILNFFRTLIFHDDTAEKLSINL